MRRLLVLIGLFLVAELSAQGTFGVSETITISSTHIPISTFSSQVMSEGKRQRILEIAIEDNKMFIELEHYELDTDDGFVITRVKYLYLVINDKLVQFAKANGEAIQAIDEVDGQGNIYYRKDWVYPKWVQINNGVEIIIED